MQQNKQIAIFYYNMQQDNYSKQVIWRLMNVLSMHSIKHIADYLEVKEGTFRSWMSRDSLDIRLVVAKCNSDKLAYVLTGEKQAEKASQKASQDASLKANQSKKEESDPELQLIIAKQISQIHLERIENLSAKNAVLKKENTQLKEENGKLRAENAVLKGESKSSNKQHRSAS